MSALTMISQAVAAGGLTGARPALTLCLLQLHARLFATTSLPHELEWMVSWYAIGVVAALALAESFARSDPQFDELLHVPNLIIGVVAAVATAVIIVGLAGEPLSAAGESSTPVALAGILSGLVSAAGAALVAAPVASLGVGWTRRRLLKAVDVVPVRKRVWRWLETGTVASGLAAVMLLPALAVALATLLVLGAAAIGLGVLGAERALDRRARTVCACGHAVRREALCCPRCGAALEPTKKLGQPDQD